MIGTSCSSSFNFFFANDIYLYVISILFQSNRWIDIPITNDDNNNNDKRMHKFVFENYVFIYYLLFAHYTISNKCIQWLIFLFTLLFSNFFDGSILVSEKKRYDQQKYSLKLSIQLVTIGVFVVIEVGTNI